MAHLSKVDGRDSLVVGWGSCWLVALEWDINIYFGLGWLGDLEKMLQVLAELLPDWMLSNENLYSLP